MLRPIRANPECWSRKIFQYDNSPNAITPDQDPHPLPYFRTILWTSGYLV